MPLILTNNKYKAIKHTGFVLLENEHKNFKKWPMKGNEQEGGFGLINKLHNAKGGLLDTLFELQTALNYKQCRTVNLATIVSTSNPIPKVTSIPTPTKMEPLDAGPEILQWTACSASESPNKI